MDGSRARFTLGTSIKTALSELAAFIEIGLILALVNSRLKHPFLDELFRRIGNSRETCGHAAIEKVMPEADMKQYKSMIFVLVMMIAVLIVSTAAVDAQSASIPAYTITSVTAGLEVTVQTKDFPASTDFVVRMRDFDAGGNAMSVARFNSGAGGAFGLALPIPSEVAGARTIEMTIVSASDPFGLSITSQFANGGPGGKVSCNYSVIPTFNLDAVAKNGSVTVTTAKFPPNSTFKVKMGVITGGSIVRYGIKGFSTYELPDPYYDGSIGPIVPLPWSIPYVPIDPSLYTYNLPDPVVPPCWPTGQDCAYTTITVPGSGTIFSGIEVGTYESIDGSPQTVSYPIPTELKDVSPIILRFEDQGPCGIYSFGYFWNADFPVAGTVPTVEIQPIR